MQPDTRLYPGLSRPAVEIRAGAGPRLYERAGLITRAHGPDQLSAPQASHSSRCQVMT